jgi:UDP-N-acetylmuramyl pentapeptide phosphotransferase/UDP-N-acetylglucosamine-1-phosphate transferase
MIQDLLDSFNLENNLIVWLIGAFVIAFIITSYTFPTVLYVAKRKRLMDEPGDRSSHSSGVPTLGGVGIYFGLVVVITITGVLLNARLLLLLLGAMTILFFLGLKDDLMVLSPKKKFLVQILVAFFVIVFTDTRIVGFSNILGVETLPYWISVGFTLFVYVLIVNAYNLIDGVDGLAGSIALCASVVFSAVFVIDKNYSLATISVGLAGSLIPFLRLNFSKRYKIFMGDTGSMILGFLLAFFAIGFISNAQTNDLSAFHSNSPALVLAILFYPLMDTLRIFFIRIFIHKKSPFEADKNHIHHRFIDSNFSHPATTAFIVGINLIIIAIAYCCSGLNLNIQIIALILYGVTLYTIPFIFFKKQGRGVFDKQIQSK